MSWLMPVAMWPYQPSQASMAVICREHVQMRHIGKPLSVMQRAQLLPVGYSSFGLQHNTYDSAAQTCRAFHVLHAFNTATVKQISDLCTVQVVRRVFLMQWQPGDFIISDNLGVAHEASPQTQMTVSDVGLRVMHRTTIAGEHHLHK